MVCLTAYTARIAQFLDAHCDLLLVGDSMGWCCMAWTARKALSLI